MSVKFIGNGNGLVEVATPPTAWLKIRHAPEEGYRQDYVCWKERSKDLSRASNFDAKRNFAFRIRTERDEDGRITSAYYGKIYGDICFKKLVGENVEAVASPCFQYYLNPAPNDRNLEWDMKNNSSQVNFGQGDNVHETPVRQPKAMQEGVCWMQTPFAVASADEYVY